MGNRASTVASSGVPITATHESTCATARMAGACTAPGLPVGQAHELARRYELHDHGLRARRDALDAPRPFEHEHDDVSPRTRPAERPIGADHRGLRTAHQQVDRLWCEADPGRDPLEHLA